MIINGIFFFILCIFISSLSPYHIVLPGLVKVIQLVLSQVSFFTRDKVRYKFYPRLNPEDISPYRIQYVELVGIIIPRKFRCQMTPYGFCVFQLSVVEQIVWRKKLVLFLAVFVVFVLILSFLGPH